MADLAQRDGDVPASSCGVAPHRLWPTNQDKPRLLRSKIVEEMPQSLSDHTPGVGGDKLTEHSMVGGIYPSSRFAVAKLLRTGAVVAWAHSASQKNLWSGHTAQVVTASDARRVSLVEGVSRFRR
jgi:hypothetical protein